MTIIIHAYKFRIYPTKSQEHMLIQTLDTCRHLYNDSLDERNKYHFGFFDQKKLLTQRRKEDKYLKQIHSQVAQNVVLRLDKAFQAFFLHLTKYPKFKRNTKYNSFTYPQYGGFRFDENKKKSRIRLAMIGSIKIRLHREPIGTPKACTVIRDIDQWFVCITTEVDNVGDVDKETSVSMNNNNTSVGIDLGLTTLATLSDGKEFENPRHLQQSVTKIKQQQRNLSRKTKGSNNRRKARILLAKTWRKVRRQRDDTAHKISRHLADNYETIVFEDLKIPQMVKNHNLASAIMDAAWGKLRLLTAYKAEQRGGQVMLVDPSGTTQKCSGCGNVVPKDLSERMHECPYCGLCIGRDLNSAREILQRGLEQAHVEGEPLLVQRKRISKFNRGSKKPTNFSCG